MALHWAWTFGIRATATQYADSGWVHASLPNPSTVNTVPRQPTAGFGGSDYTLKVNSNNSDVKSPTFPKGDLADGWIQFHIYCTNWSLTPQIFRLWDAAGTTLLFSLKCTSSGATTTLEVWSGEGTQTQRGTTTGTLNINTWHVVAVRFKPAGASGEIEVSIDGAEETIVATGAVGATSNWGRFGMGSASSRTFYYAQITVWDDPTDDAGTLTKWVALLKPTADRADGVYLNQAGSAVDMYTSVNEAVPEITNYATSTTAADTIKFDVDTADIDAAWAPDTIYGVGIVCSARGEGTLVTARPILGKSAETDVQGALQTTDADSSFLVNDIFVQQAGATAWDVAGVDAGEYGMKNG